MFWLRTPTVIFRFGYNVAEVPLNKLEDNPKGRGVQQKSTRVA